MHLALKNALKPLRVIDLPYDHLVINVCGGPKILMFLLKRVFFFLKNYLSMQLFNIQFPPKNTL